MWCFWISGEPNAASIPRRGRAKGYSRTKKFANPNYSTCLEIFSRTPTQPRVMNKEDPP